MLHLALDFFEELHLLSVGGFRRYEFSGHLIEVLFLNNSVAFGLIKGIKLRFIVFAVENVRIIGKTGRHTQDI
ncbi:hypothetical protein D3C85_1790510 [compost metagenome]